LLLQLVQLHLLLSELLLISLDSAAAASDKYGKASEQQTAWKNPTLNHRNN
jgi:hypothetical protein